MYIGPREQMHSIGAHMLYRFKEILTFVLCLHDSDTDAARRIYKEPTRIIIMSQDISN